MYDELYDVWKKEKEKENEILQLPKNFYSTIAIYIKKLIEENRMLDKKTLKAKLLSTEFKYAKVMITELFLLRYAKFRTKVFSRETIGKDILADEEKKLYGDISSSSEACQIFSKDILRGYLTRKETGNKKNLTVLRFVQEIPALVGADMKTYGPFGPEDIATLPPENARILVKKGMAVEVHSN